MTRLSIPFGAPFRKWSNQLYASVANAVASGAEAGEVPGGLPRSPRESRFGPFSTLYAASAWSMSKRKSLRPWISSVGVVIEESREIGERDAANALTGAMFVLEMSDCFAASNSGSHRLSGTAAASNETSPDLDRPCGASAGARFVHVITGTIALTGT